jgi:TonB family protein
MGKSYGNGRLGLVLAVSAICFSASMAQTTESAPPEVDAQTAEAPVEVIVREARQIGVGKDGYVEQARPQYPLLGKRYGIEGKVDAAVLINREGRPLKAVIIRREPFYTFIFDEPVRKALMQSKYHRDVPQDGKKVAWLRAPFRFLLEGSDKLKSATVVKLAAPVFPARAAEQGLEGWVAMAVSVDPNGKPDMANSFVLGRGPAYFSDFDAKAREAVEKSEFKPATFDGVAQYGGLVVRIDFRIPEE